ncbi:MAG: DUF1840 domain-containing protein [Burkholderiales bacterium]|nr:DUF1840 domain-containing protein [Burkholderiales bacterium]
MLIEFRSDAGDMTMFGEPGVALLKMMGQSGELPGAILAKDIPAALERLERALAATPPGAPAQSARASGADGEPRISIRQRAWPLIELLRRCVKKNCDLLWGEKRPLVPPKPSR